MPKQVPDKELNEIAAIISEHAEGITGPDINEKLVSRLPARNLQRRLSALIEQNRIIASGTGRGRIYRPVVAVQGLEAKVGVGTAKVETTDYPPISQESEEIKRRVEAPISQRQPVGYNRDFLDSYRPNETYYLPEDVRARLAQIGLAPAAGQAAGTYVRDIYNRLLVDLSWNSSRLEGNTYSLLETERLLELGESAGDKDAQEAQMILNHKDAIELLVEQADEVGINRFTVLNLHASLSENLLPDPAASGRLRQIGVGIERSVFHPLEVPQQIEEAFNQLLDTASAIKNPFEQAFFLMVHLPYLQPFEGVNKRVSRLAANIPLIKNNLCPLSFVDVLQEAYVHGLLGVYELNRIELLRDIFVWAYERSCARYAAVQQSLGQPDPIKLRYREQILEIVSRIVRGGADKNAAIGIIRDVSKNEINEEDRKKFEELCENELMNLHEGKIARYRIRPSEYDAWKNNWK